MKIPPQLLEHNTLMLAILTLARQLAEALEVDPSAPLAEICRTLGANRTSVYEQIQRLLACLDKLAQVRPGRPPADATPEPDSLPAALRLTVEVLEFRLQHPGAVIEPKLKPRPSVPANASQLTRLVVDEWMRWVGPARPFIPHAAECFDLSPARKKTLIRLYEAPKQQRLALLDLITAQQHGLR